jgi:hypothetical protein
MFYEIFSDEAAFAVHQETAHFKQIILEEALPSPEPSGTGGLSVGLEGQDWGCHLRHHPPQAAEEIGALLRISVRRIKVAMASACQPVPGRTSSRSLTSDCSTPLPDTNQTPRSRHSANLAADPAACRNLWASARRGNRAFEVGAGTDEDVSGSVLGNRQPVHIPSGGRIADDVDPIDDLPTSIPYR